MSLIGEKIYKEGLQNVLFSNQNRLKSKINIILLIFCTLASSYSFIQIYFLKSEGFSSIPGVLMGLFFSLSFIFLGYRWFINAGLNYKGEIKWLWISIFISIPFLFIHYFIGSDLSLLRYLWIPSVLLTTYSSAHKIYYIFKISRKNKLFEIINSLFFFGGLILSGLMISNISSFSIVKTSFASFFILGSWTLSIIKLFKGNYSKLIFDNGNSTRVIILGVFVGPIFLLFVSILDSFIFSSISLIGIIVQLLIGIFLIYLQHKKTNEFKTSFIKNFILSIIMFTQLSIVLAIRELQNMNFMEINYSLNLFVATIIISYSISINIYYKVSLKLKNTILENSATLSIVVATSVIAIMNTIRVFEIFDIFPADEFLIFISLIFVLPQIFSISLNLYIISSKKERRILWR
ncbi:MAG: hypothetical protein HRT99_01950 [Mycoplasmatales bacterium]|nr:hypothetical protein [Mycoplasmatales bacterium]